MEYLINDTSEIKSQGEIRKLNPNMSLPRVWDANVCEALGITPVLAAPKPEPSGEFKSVVRNGVTTDALGNTVQAWTERDMFSDYTDEDGTVHTKAEQEQAYLGNLLSTAKEQKISAIDTDTKTKILELCSEPMQRNYLAKYNELLEKKVDGTITPDETTQMSTLKTLWLQIEQLRIAGNAKESQVSACTTVAEVEGVEV